MAVTQDAITQAILAAASENSDLLVRLSSTEEAPALLANQLKQVSKIQDELAEQDAHLEQLRKELDAQFRLHKKFRDSTARRLLYRATRMLPKFEALAMKEEQEYFTILNTRSKAEERRMLLQTGLNEAVKGQELLEAASEEHQHIHERVDTLYESLFSGPTPGFPHEDEREHGFYAARGNNDSTKARIVTAGHALRKLNQALRNIRRSQAYLETAYKEAGNSLLFFDDARFSLDSSNNHITYALSEFDGATDVLRPVPSDFASVKQSIITSLHKAITDPNALNWREGIQTAIANAEACLSEVESQLDGLIAFTKQRREHELAALKATARQLEDSRQALHQTRMGIFEQVAGFGEAAPAYTECCDRAESFCALPEEPREDGESEGLGASSPVLPSYGATLKTTYNSWAGEGAPSLERDVPAYTTV